MLVLASGSGECAGEVLEVRDLDPSGLACEGRSCEHLMNQLGHRSAEANSWSAAVLLETLALECDSMLCLHSHTRAQSEFLGGMVGLPADPN